MPIVSLRTQGVGSDLRKYFQWLADHNPYYSATKDSMIRFMDAIDEYYPNRMIYALTSTSNIIVLKDEEGFPPKFWICSEALGVYEFVIKNSPDESIIYKMNSVEEAINCFDNLMDIPLPN